MSCFLNLSHANGLFLNLLNTSENKRIYYVMRGYRKRPVAWNGLNLKNIKLVCLKILFNLSFIFLMLLKIDKSPFFAKKKSTWSTLFSWLFPNSPKILTYSYSWPFSRLPNFLRFPDSLYWVNKLGFSLYFRKLKIQSN